MSIMLRNVGHELLSARVGLLRVPNSVYSPTAIDLRATGFAAPVLRATPDPITFDDTVVGSARITTISVGNPGAVSVPIGTINLQATGDCRIVRDKCAGVTLDVGETCRVEVAFQPTATGATATALEISGPASPLMRQLPRPGRGLPRFEAMCHCFPLFIRSRLTIAWVMLEASVGICGLWSLTRARVRQGVGWSGSVCRPADRRVLHNFWGAI
jgi:hypothetical protein